MRTKVVFFTDDSQGRVAGFFPVKNRGEVWMDLPPEFIQGGVVERDYPTQGFYLSISGEELPDKFREPTRDEVITLVLMRIRVLRAEEEKERSALFHRLDVLKGRAFRGDFYFLPPHGAEGTWAHGECARLCMPLAVLKRTARRTPRRGALVYLQETCHFCAEPPLGGEARIAEMKEEAMGLLQKAKAMAPKEATRLSAWVDEVAKIVETFPPAQWERKSSSLMSDEEWLSHVEAAEYCRLTGGGGDRFGDAVLACRAILAGNFPQARRQMST